jgi:glutaredoxin
VKAWLSQAGVSFEVRNVDEDPTAYDELLARGFRSVPVTIVGELAIVGYQPGALAAAISGAAAG